MRFAMVVLWMLLASPAIGTMPKVTVTDAVTDLDMPWAVAIHPNSGDVFVSETGKGRILRGKRKGHVVFGIPSKKGAEKPDRSYAPVVTGFPVDAKKPKTDRSTLRIGDGPLSLAFLDKNTLVSATGRRADNADALRVYAIPSTKTTRLANEPALSIDVRLAGDTPSSHELDIRGVAVGADAILVACHGTVHQNGIVRVAFKNGKPSPPRLLVPLPKTERFGVPDGITMSPEGYVVVGKMGESAEQGPSELAFYNAHSGTLLSRFPTSLRHIVSLAYHPKSGRLYALDFTGQTHTDDGLYRLDSILTDGKAAVRTVKILSLDRPTSMAIDPNGVMYVTVLGSSDDETDNDKKPGKLLRIEGDL